MSTSGASFWEDCAPTLHDQRLSCCGIFARVGGHVSRLALVRSFGKPWRSNVPVKPHTKLVRVRALRVVQDAAHPLFLFTLSAKELLAVADVSRVSRDDTGRLIGYQRAEVRRHVRDIVEYLDSSDVLFPNPIILALSSKARFTGSRGPRVGVSGVTAGTLEIQLPRNGGARPAWIVDGQQRALALSKSRRQDLIVPVNAFIADDVAIQRDQFLRINNTKPLPRGLITELLPEVSSPLPAVMAARRLPAAMCELLCTPKLSVARSTRAGSDSRHFNRQDAPREH